MKILCDRTQLQEAVGIVSSVVPSKTPKPVLQNILLRADQAGITLFATDLEISAMVHLDSVKVNKPGAILLPSRETSALLREISDPTVTLESQDNRCRIESAGGSFTLVGEDPEQFPDPSKFASANKLEIPAGRLLRMIQETSFAAAREETRYAINGVLFDLSAGVLRLVATDGRRLSISSQHLETGKTQFKVVIPIRALTTLARALPEGGKETVQIAVGENQIEFSFGKVKLTSQLLETRFPDYEGVIPKHSDTTVTIQRSLLESSLRKAAILCADDIRMVRFEVGDSSLRLVAESSSRGRADLSIDVDVKGPGGAINFNPDYILEALRVSDLDAVGLDMSDDAAPARFKLADTFTYIVMPISGA
jgi:DNA polymerase-3 subunit beta